MCVSIMSVSNTFLYSPFNLILIHSYLNLLFSLFLLLLLSLVDRYDPAEPSTPSPPASPGPAEEWQMEIGPDGSRLFANYRMEVRKRRTVE